MDDPERATAAIGCCVHRVEAAQNLTDQVDDEIVLEPLAIAGQTSVQSPEIAAGDVFESEVWLTLDFAVTQDVNHVRVSNATGESRLFSEHRVRVRSVRDMWQHALQNDDTRLTDGARLQCAKHFGHPTHRDAVHQRVGAERSVGWWCGWR